MNNDVLREVTSVANKIGIEPEFIIHLMEEALGAVLEKQIGEFVKIKAVIDRDTGELIIYRSWEIVDEEIDDDEVACKISLEEAHEHDENYEVGQYHLKLVKDSNLSRIAAHHARHLILRAIRRAEQMKIAESYRSRIGEIINGEVKKVTRDAIYMDLGSQIEAVILRDEMMSREMLRPGDRIRGYLYEVEGDEENNPRLLLSRSCPEMLSALFALEVPEVGDDVIKIMAVARDPGMRSKIVVKTNDGRIDPIGACVGMRGSRVQAVSSELNNERIDVILWSQDPAELVINALAPAEVLTVTVNEDNNSMDIVVADDTLAKAIGRSGQNIKLASKITGWDLNIVGKSDSEATKVASDSKVIQGFAEKLDVDDEIAGILVREGFSSIESIAYGSESSFIMIEEFDEEIADLLKGRAKQVLLESAVGSSEDDNDLELVPNLSGEMIAVFNGAGIQNQDDLADAAVDELVDLDAEISEEMAAEWIMYARRRWFADEEG